MAHDHSGSDRELIEACIQRDMTAWAVFVKKYSRLIDIAIRHRLRSHNIKLSAHDLDDIRQNILALLWKDHKLESVRGRDKINYWLAMVSGNMAIEYVRHRLRRGAAETVSLFEKVGEEEFCDFVEAPLFQIEDEDARDELAGRVEAALESLPAKERMIFKLNLFHNKKYSEIAELLRLPPGTVSSYIKRAKERLRSELKDFA